MPGSRWICGKVAQAVSTEGVCVGLHTRVGSLHFQVPPSLCVVRNPNRRALGYGSEASCCWPSGQQGDGIAQVPISPSTEVLVQDGQALP